MADEFLLQLCNRQVLSSRLKTLDGPVFKCCSRGFGVWASHVFLGFAGQVLFNDGDWWYYDGIWYASVEIISEEKLATSGQKVLKYDREKATPPSRSRTEPRAQDPPRSTRFNLTSR